MNFGPSVPTRKSGFLVVLAICASIATVWYSWAVWVAVGLLACAYAIEVVSRSWNVKAAERHYTTSAQAQSAKMSAISALAKKELEVEELTREMVRRQQHYDASVRERRDALAGYVISLDGADKSAAEIIESLLGPMRPETAAKRISEWEGNTGRYGSFVVAYLQAKAARTAYKVPV